MELFTSVHQDYFCPRLKLSVISYAYSVFCSSQQCPITFYITPGVLMQISILTTEKIRKQYIRVFEEFERTNNCTENSVCDKKFIASGLKVR